MTINQGIIPVLDYRMYLSDRDEFVEKLRSACHRVGFFLLRHHLPEGLARRQLEEARQFFQQSLDDKMKLSYEKNSAFRGYMRMGVENTGGNTDVREQIEFGTEYNQGEPASGESPLYERLKGKNQWPKDFQPQLREHTMEYVDHVRRIADSLRKALCLSLGVHQDTLNSLFEEPQWFLKLISYPKCTEVNTHSSYGVGAHTDTNFITLVLQDNAGGLQVFSSGVWIDVPTDMGEDVLVCNLGEQAELFSRGYFLATPHRVLADTSSHQDRVSVPLFYNPSLSAVISASDADIDALPWERAEDYDKNHHWRMEGNVILETVGDNTFKSLARSHPTVFAKHHQDLVRLADGRIIRRCKEK